MLLRASLLAMVVLGGIDASATESELELDDSAARTFQGKSGGQLRYRQLDVQDAKAAQEYPPVIFLHEAGARGTSNSSQVVHGAEDRTVQPEKPREMVSAITVAGSEPGYSGYPGVAHNSRTRVYPDPRFRAWMFAQRRAARSAK